MTLLFPARAVEMQKARVATSAIAEALDVTVNQVVSWWKLLGYDPLVYHAEEIATALAEGQSISAAVRAVGLPMSGYISRRLEELGLRRRLATRRVAQQARYLDTRPRCVCCTILLEPYDPADLEQRSWQNGTRNGTHCTQCESIIDAGGSWLGHLPLPSIEDHANRNLGEVFGIGY